MELKVEPVKVRFDGVVVQESIQWNWKTPADRDANTWSSSPKNPFNGIERLSHLPLYRIVEPVRIHSMELKDHPAPKAKNGVERRRIHSMELKVSASHCASFGALARIHSMELKEITPNNPQALINRNPFNGIERRSRLCLWRGLVSLWIHSMELKDKLELQTTTMNRLAPNPFNGIERKLCWRRSQLSPLGHWNPFNGIERAQAGPGHQAQEKRIHSMELKVIEEHEVSKIDDVLESIQWNWKRPATCRRTYTATAWIHSMELKDHEYQVANINFILKAESIQWNWKPLGACTSPSWLSRSESIQWNWKGTRVWRKRSS